MSEMKFIVAQNVQNNKQMDHPSPPRTTPHMSGFSLFLSLPQWSWSSENLQCDYGKSNGPSQTHGNSETTRTQFQHHWTIKNE